MQLTLTLDEKQYQVGLNPIDLAIPLDFQGRQPSTYGVPPATGKAYEGDGFVGDVRQGGGVNFETYELTPHCNGTHTECVGHITHERISVHSVLRESWAVAQVHSVAPVSPAQIQDSYDPPLASGDRIITAEQLAPVWENWQPGQALVIRTLPNHPDKRYTDYMEQAPPFFSLEAMQAIRANGVKHLLVDFPSVDRLFDGGKLRNHRTFWGLEPGQRHLPFGGTPNQTITEMIFVPEEVEDGQYLLELQIAPFVADAAPSRPRLFSMEP